MAEVVSKGTTLSWSGTAVSQIQSFNGPAVQHEALDVSDLDDAARARLAAGIYNLEPVTLELNWDANNAGIHDSLLDACIAGTSGATIITWPDSGTTTWTFTTFVTRFEPRAAVGESLGATVELTPSGTLAIA